MSNFQVRFLRKNKKSHFNFLHFHQKSLPLQPNAEMDLPFL